MTAAYLTLLIKDYMTVIIVADNLPVVSQFMFGRTLSSPWRRVSDLCPNKKDEKLQWG